MPLGKQSGMPCLRNWAHAVENRGSMRRNSGGVSGGCKVLLTAAWVPGPALGTAGLSLLVRQLSPLGQRAEAS